MKILPSLIISLIISLTLLHSARAAASDDAIGKIVLKEGITEKSSLNCQGSECHTMVIRRGDRIRTGRDSKAQVMLNDGTGIIIYERSDIIFNFVIRPGRKKPTDIYVGYGKFKFIQNNNYLETSLVVRTANSIIKSVNATFCLVQPGANPQYLSIPVKQDSPALKAQYLKHSLLKRGRNRTFPPVLNPQSRPEWHPPCMDHG